MKQYTKSSKGFTLVEMLGVLAIIAILISVIAVGVLSAITRARIVATTANFKNLETAVVGFVALPATGGTVPLTAGKLEGNTSGSADVVDIVVNNAGNAEVVIESNNGDAFTLNQALLSAGLIDRSFSWRVGRDGMAQINLANEKTFRISKNAFNDTSYGNPASGSGNANWNTYNRAEASAVAALTDVFSNSGATLKIDDSAGLNFKLDGQTGLTANRVAYVVLTGVSLKDAKKLSQELNGPLDDSEEAIVYGQEKGRFIFAAPLTENGLVTCYYYLASF